MKENNLVYLYGKDRVKRDNFLCFGAPEKEKVKKINSKATLSNLFSETQYNGQSPVRFSIQ